MYKSIIRYMLLLAFLLMLVSCAQGMVEPAPVADAPPAPAAAVDAMPPPQDIWFYAAEVAGGGDFIDREQQAPTQRLIIQTASVQLETESFDSAVSNLRSIPSVFGGYTQSERLFTVNRQQRFEIVIRVPAADFENALNQIEQIAFSRSINVSAEDVTDQFYDMSARLETRLIEEERILALIDQTNTLRELLDLESRLSSTRLQIERYRTSLADLAGRITYSTIHVHLFDMEETYEAIAAATFGERIGGAFGSSIDGTISVFQFLIVVLAGAIIPLTIISPLIILLVFRYRKKAALAIAESG